MAGQKRKATADAKATKENKDSVLFLFPTAAIAQEVKTRSVFPTHWPVLLRLPTAPVLSFDRQHLGTRRMQGVRWLPVRFNLLCQLHKQHQDRREGVSGYFGVVKKPSSMSRPWKALGWKQVEDTDKNGKTVIKLKGKQYLGSFTTTREAALCKDEATRMIVAFKKAEATRKGLFCFHTSSGVQ